MISCQKDEIYDITPTDDRRRTVAVDSTSHNSQVNQVPFLRRLRLRLRRRLQERIVARLRA